MNAKSLNGEWRLYITDKAMSATSETELSDITAICALIPESLEATLERVGIIDELYMGKNILKAQEYERKHLYYSCVFEYTPDDGMPYIKFDGIDTVAEVFLNGELIGRADNAFIPHEFEAQGIKEGENELFVHIIPAVEIEQTYTPVWQYGSAYAKNGGVALRKPAYMHGWDIFPRVMSGAIWKNVSLISKTPELIESVYFYTKQVVWRKAVVHIDYVTAEGDELVVSGVCAPSSFKVTLPAGKGGADIDIQDPLVWNPKGMGKPNLYAVKLSLVREGKTVAQKEYSFGVRTFELKRTSVTDKDGNGEFCFYVNGNRMFVLGTNHVPVDAILSKQAERLPKVLELLDESGCNTVRVWGGGVYEADEFYDFCDRRGILVWQDFMMACAVYPEDADFCENLRKEAQYTVKRLRNHPSLALWAGDNEVDSVRAEWYPEKLDPNKNKLTREVLPAVLADLDPMRAYIPSSPYFDEECFAKGTELSPENHLWGPRDYYRSEYYENSLAHFASEIGYHGCPNVESVKRFITSEKLWAPEGNEEWRVHSTDTSLTEPDFGRVELMERQAELISGKKFDNIEEFAFASQVSQAEAMKHFVESFLAQKWRKSGIIWWNLIDGYPQFSDALVDYYFNKKLAFEFVKRLQQPLCLIIDDQMTLRIINNTENESFAKYKVTNLSDGAIVAQGSMCVGYNANTKVCKIDYPVNKGDVLFIEWDYCSSGIVGGRSGINHYLCGEPPFDLEKYASLMKKAGLI